MALQFILPIAAMAASAAGNYINRGVQEDSKKKMDEYNRQRAQQAQEALRRRTQAQWQARMAGDRHRDSAWQAERAGAEQFAKALGQFEVDKKKAGLKDAQGKRIAGQKEAISDNVSRLESSGDAKGKVSDAYEGRSADNTGESVDRANDLGERHGRLSGYTPDKLREGNIVQGMKSDQGLLAQRIRNLMNQGQRAETTGNLWADYKGYNPLSEEVVNLPTSSSLGRGLGHLGTALSIAGAGYGAAAGGFLGSGAQNWAGGLNSSISGLNPFAAAPSVPATSPWGYSSSYNPIGMGPGGTTGMFNAPSSGLTQYAPNFY